MAEVKDLVARLFPAEKEERDGDSSVVDDDDDEDDGTQRCFGFGATDVSADVPPWRRRLVYYGQQI